MDKVKLDKKEAFTLKVVCEGQFWGKGHIRRNNATIDNLVFSIIGEYWKKGIKLSEERKIEIKVGFHYALISLEKKGLVEFIETGIYNGAWWEKNVKAVPTISLKDFDNVYA